MKNIFIPLLSLAVVSCSTPTSNVNTQDLSNVVRPNALYDANATKVGFGAFKTTDKKEVKGWFTDFTIGNLVDTNQLELVFGAATFEINVSSLETNDAGRNQRLLTEFFGKTTSAEKLTGKVISFDKDKSSLNVQLDFNGIQKEVPFMYAMSGDTLQLNASINMLDYNASTALTALNKACEDLHKGADGVSKTWSDVNLYLTTVLKK